VVQEKKTARDFLKKPQAASFRHPFTEIKPSAAPEAYHTGQRHQ
jgi:hypothetical protein